MRWATEERKRLADIHIDEMVGYISLLEVREQLRYDEAAMIDEKEVLLFIAATYDIRGKRLVVKMK